MSPSSQSCIYCGSDNPLQEEFCQRCGAQLPTSAGAASVPQTSQASTLQVSQAAPSATALAPGRVLAQRYVLGKLLGQGGMGAVYQVQDQCFGGATRALKALNLSGLSLKEQQEATVAFEQEALMLARLTHPNLPRVYDHFVESSNSYLVMDYIEGETLEKRLSKQPRGWLPYREAISLVLQLCSVLHYLHSQRSPVIFRDLKPANIMLTAEDHVYLIDFGIARLFKPGQSKDTVAMGSLGYAAPEQYGKSGTQTTPRTDIYALGAVLHQMLSGHDPSEDPLNFPPLHLPRFAGREELQALVERMVAVKREQRPASIEEVRQTLQDITTMKHRPPASKPPAANAHALPPAVLKPQASHPQGSTTAPSGQPGSIQGARQQAQMGSMAQPQAHAANPSKRTVLSNRWFWTLIYGIVMLVCVLLPIVIASIYHATDWGLIIGAGALLTLSLVAGSLLGIWRGTLVALLIPLVLLALYKVTLLPGQLDVFICYCVACPVAAFATGLRYEDNEGCAELGFWGVLALFVAMYMTLASGDLLTDATFSFLHIIIILVACLLLGILAAAIRILVSAVVSALQ